MPGLELTNHRFGVPLDYADPSGAKISVFAREVVDLKRKDEDLPWLVFLQGGPGGLSPRPQGKENWIKKATERFRVLLLDQRGVGLSSPISFQTLSGMNPEEQAAYLSHFRADNIVRDCETIRKELIGGRKWSALGQSFGGFCMLNYLSFAPEGLSAAYITGGVPSVTRHIDDVYHATHKTVIRKNKKYFERFPEDRQIVADIAKYLEYHDVRLPNGDRFTVNRLRQLGMDFGMSEGAASLHYLLELASIDGPEKGELSHAFLTAAHNRFNFDSGPIFAILHEAIYCQGFASDWSADRVRKKYPEFEGTDDFHFMGEMIGRWMFNEFDTLKPLQRAADILAAKTDWPALYDVEQLKRNEVPTACAVYHEDMYVWREFSLETVDMVPHMEAWVDSEFDHCALRTQADKVLPRLFDMVDGEV
jgi:pimeloyl-ACP methyl ester carboxylesterase